MSIYLSSEISLNDEKLTFTVKVAGRTVATMKYRADAERVRDAAFKYIGVLPECSPKDLCGLAGVDDRDCVSDRKYDRLGLIWGRDAEDEWYMLVVPAYQQKYGGENEIQSDG